MVELRKTTGTRRIPERLNELETRLELHLKEDLTIHENILREMAINTELTRKTAETGEENKALMKTIADNTTELVSIVKTSRVVLNGTKLTAVWIRRLALWATPILVVIGLIVEWTRRH